MEAKEIYELLKKFDGKYRHDLEHIGMAVFNYPLSNLLSVELLKTLAEQGYHDFVYRYVAFEAVMTTRNAVVATGDPVLFFSLILVNAITASQPPHTLSVAVESVEKGFGLFL